MLGIVRYCVPKSAYPDSALGSSLLECFDRAEVLESMCCITLNALGLHHTNTYLTMSDNDIQELDKVAEKADPIHLSTQVMTK